MRIIITFLMLSGFLLSQPINKDTADKKSPLEEIPAVVKPTVEEIVTNSEEAKKASFDLTKEMKKQLEIIRQIKKQAQILKNTTEGQKVLVSAKNQEEKKIVYMNAIKPDTVRIQYNGQPIKYEYREKTMFGIVFFSGYYPYIVGKNNEKIYIK